MGAFDLFQTVSPDLDFLTASIADNLASAHALQDVRQAYAGTPVAAAIADLNWSDNQTRRQTAWRAICGDCINRVTEAVLADGVFDEQEYGNGSEG